MNRSFRVNVGPVLRRAVLRRGAVFGAILLCALLAFEIFNYATTSFALSDVLGDLRTAGVRWSTVLALAFCGIDFAGIARLFTPRGVDDEPGEVWYLFAAWALAASFNALLTWWGVSVAIASHTAEGSVLIGKATFTHVAPVLLAVTVWMVRVLIIGTFSLAGDGLFSMAAARTTAGEPDQRAASFPRPAARQVPALRSSAGTAATGHGGEPSYQPVAMSALGQREHGSQRQ